MSTKFIEMFVKNQLMFNPNYDGEVIILNNEYYDTSELARKYRGMLTKPNGSGSLELIMRCIADNDAIKMQKRDGTYSTLRDIIEPFKQELPIIYKAEDFLKNILEDMKKRIIKETLNTRDIERGSYNSVLVTGDERLNEKEIEEAFKHLFGLKSTRIVYTRTKGSLNGNFLDIVDKDFCELGLSSGRFTSTSNIIRSMGFPYSDYREYISYGILVSVSLNDLVTIVKEDYAYCCNVTKFAQFLEKPSRFEEWCSSFHKVFVLDELKEDKKIQLEIIR